MNTDGTGFYTCKECHQTESLSYHITTDHKEEEQLKYRRNVGESSCNSGDGTDQRVQSLMFIMTVLSSLRQNRVHCRFLHTSVKQINTRCTRQHKSHKPLYEIRHSNILCRVHIYDFLSLCKRGLITIQIL